MVIKLPIADFELGIDVFRIRDRGFKSSIPNPKTLNPKTKLPIGKFITNW